VSDVKRSGPGLFKTQKHICIQKCTNEPFKNYHSYLSFFNYETCGALTGKQSSLLRCTKVHVHSRRWVNEHSFISVHCFHKAAFKKLKVSFSSITTATVIVLSQKVQNHLTANNHRNLATVLTTHILKAIRLKIP
jgi:hypothetical protein